MSTSSLANSSKHKAIFQIAVAALLVLVPMGLGASGGVIVFFLIPALLFAYMASINYRYINVFNTYTSYFNEKNDGIFHHYFNNGTYVWEMYINTKDETVRLKSNGREKVFKFDQIKGCEYEVNSFSGSFGLEDTGTGKKSFIDTGFFVVTTDLKDPVWHIRLIAENTKINLKSSVFYTDIKRQCDSWLNVFEQVVAKQ